MRDLLFPCAGMVCALLLPLRGADGTETVLVIGNQVAGSIPPALFGQFLERPSWGGETGPEAVADADGSLPEPVLAMMAAHSPPVVRFPGGTDVDYMDWTDMISNAPGRDGPGRPVSVGTQGDEVGNRFGYDEFFRLRDRLGFDIVLVVNLRDALYRKRPLAEAARHAAGLLAYARALPGEIPLEGMPDWGAVRARNGRPDPVPVRYVMVGNEAQFFWPPRSEEERTALGLADEEACWAWLRECLTAYGRALKAVDPEVELMLDGYHDPFNPENDAANAARREVFLHPEIREVYGHLGAHAYAPMGFFGTRLRGQRIQPDELSDEQVWYGLVSAPGLFDDAGQNVALGAHYDELVAAGYRIAFTEWNFNAWNEGGVLKGRPFGIGDPARLATAGFLHGLLRHGGDASLATQSMWLGVSWNITAIRADPSGQQPPRWLPQGEVAMLYRHRTGTQRLVSRLEHAPRFRDPAQFTPWWPAVEEVSLLDVVVSRSEERLHIHAINRSPDAELPLRIVPPEELRVGAGRMETLASASDPVRVDSGAALPLRVRDLPAPGTDPVVRLPPQSVGILTFPLHSSR